MTTILTPRPAARVRAEVEVWVRVVNKGLGIRLPDGRFTPGFTESSVRVTIDVDPGHEARVPFGSLGKLLLTVGPIAE